MNFPTLGFIGILSYRTDKSPCPEVREEKKGQRADIHPCHSTIMPSLSIPRGYLGEEEVTAKRYEKVNIYPTEEIKGFYKAI